VKFLDGFFWHEQIMQRLDQQDVLRRNRGASRSEIEQFRVQKLSPQSLTDALAKG
jgi:hypothetical protein